jgi:hypothetical protein
LCIAVAGRPLLIRLGHIPLHPNLVEMARPRWLVTCWPALALAGAVAVRFLGLVVQEHHPGRKGQVDTGINEGALHGCHHPPLRAHDAGSVGSRPPEDLDVHC